MTDGLAQPDTGTVRRDYIASLRLTNFRSYACLDTDFLGGPVILFGQNGVGKTNLLEALSLLSPGRGLRGAQTQAYGLTKEGQVDASWGVSAVLGCGGQKIGTGSVPGNPNRRQLRLDGKPARGSDLAALIGFSWLTPAHDRLFVGPSSDRRKFYDRLCLVHAPEHGREWLAYEKARSERGRLFLEGISDEYWFDALEHDLAERGARIAKARYEVLQKLKCEIKARAGADFPVAELSLEGESEALFETGANEAEVAEFIKEALFRDRPIDRRAGRTLRGVHKTDLKVIHTAKAMPAAQCSTGEQKALLIGLVLAHARSQTHRMPVLLLDEVAAHLDEARRVALAGELMDLQAQVFLTGTDRHLFKAFGEQAEFFEIRDQQLVRQGVDAVPEGD